MAGNSSAEVCCSADMATISTLAYWVEGVFTFIVGSLGLFGNLVSISVLSAKDMRNAFNILLIVLASVDSFLIGFAILDYSLIRAFAVPGLGGDVYKRLFPYFLYPTTNVVLCFSIFLVVAIAFERYLAVCRPYEYRIAASTQTITSRVLKLTLPTLILAVIINIPKFFETELVEMNGDNSTVRLDIQVTDLRKDAYYINYYVNWFRLLGTGVLPMSLLIFLNISIYRKINETRKVRERQMANRLALRRFSDLGSSGGIARGGGPQNANNAPATSVTMGVMLDVQDPQRQQQQRQQQQQQVSKKDIKMAMILITIVLVFFFCHLPRVLLNLHEFFMVSKMLRCGSDNFCPPTWFLCVVSFSHLFLVINSSVNLLIYCSVGEKFRQGVKRKLNVCWYPTSYILQRILDVCRWPRRGLDDLGDERVAYDNRGEADPRAKIEPRRDEVVAPQQPQQVPAEVNVAGQMEAVAVICHSDKEEEELNANGTSNGGL